MSVYLNDWSSPRYSGEYGIDAIKADFEIKDESLDDSEVLYAAYTQEDYSGSALVVFIKDGKLFIATGGHCSCYGLEGQWQPEETQIEVLERILESGGSYYTLAGSDYGGIEENIEAMRAAISKAKEVLPKP